MKTIILSEHKDGFWLYDTTRGMNLSMRAPSKEDALMSALMYYQNRLSTIEKELNDLHMAVDTFVNSVRTEDIDL